MTTISANAVRRALRSAIARAKSKSATSSYVQGKTYELNVLTQLLSDLDSNGYTLMCTPKTKGRLTFGGSPCRPNGAEHDYISVHRRFEHYQFWVSVQFTTLSHSCGPQGAAPTHSDLHEIDVGLFEPLPDTEYPSFKRVVFAASCKAGAWSKMFMREALGLRRELGLLGGPAASRAAWFEVKVPARPAVPLALFSGDMNCTMYQGSLAMFGLYIRHLSAT